MNFLEELLAILLWPIVLAAFLLSWRAVLAIRFMKERFAPAKTASRSGTRRRPSKSTKARKSRKPSPKRTMTRRTGVRVDLGPAAPREMTDAELSRAIRNSARRAERKDRSK